MVNAHTEVKRTDVQVIGNMHRVTLIFVEALKEGPVGRVLDSPELDKLAEAKPGEKDLTRPDGKHYNYLRSAIRHVLGQYGLVYQRIQKTGCIKCVGAHEVLGIADTDRRSTHRREKRTIRKLKAVYGDASEQERAQINGKLAIHGALVAVSSASATKKLEASKEAMIPDPARLLEMLKVT